MGINLLVDGAMVVENRRSRDPWLYRSFSATFDGNQLLLPVRLVFQVADHIICHLHSVFNQRMDCRLSHPVRNAAFVRAKVS